MVQAVIVFACLRGRDEIALCEIDELVADDNTIHFQMKRDYKSHKVDAQMNVTHKPSRVIIGSRYVTILNLLKQRRKAGKHNHRLWLKPLPHASPFSDFYWSDIPVGKTTVADAVGFYVRELTKTYAHPMFKDCGHFTNSSLRKYHIN